MPNIRMFVIRFLVVLLAFQGAVAAQLLSSPAAKADSSPEVVINEIQWMGSYQGTTGHTNDEWIELYNPTTNNIQLDNWQLSNTGLPAFTSGTVIPARGYFLISNYDKTDSNSVLDTTPDLVDSALMLNNSCAVIQLLDSSSAVVDSMGCNGSSYLAGLNDTTNHVRRAMERNSIIADGTIASSWHDSIGFANLDMAAQGNTFATPKVANDITPAVGGVVSDQGQFTASLTTLQTNWSGFADPESGVASYLVGVGTVSGLNDVAGPVLEATTSHLFTGLSLSENTTYYSNVIAINGVGLQAAAVSSDGITVNTLDPNTPTNLQVSDVVSDNGGSIKATWDASTSPDVVSYQVNYRKQGDSSWSSVTSNVTNVVVGGLENSPVTYEFTVEAVDFNNQHSPASSIVTAQGFDDLVPAIDATKVVLTQSAPGTMDKVEGQAGVVSEAGTANVYDRDPNLSSPLLIGSMPINADFNFQPIYIGDNLYGQAWLQVVDSAGNKSVALKLNNDIVSPNAPTLTSLDASCTTDCQVKLTWQDNGPDTLAYQVGYVVDDVEQRSLRVTTASATLTLVSDKAYDFVVYAIDGAGNTSIASNKFSAQLTNGVRTAINLVNGAPVVETAALSGAKETITATRSSALFAPTKVQAAEPSTTPTTDEASKEKPTETEGSSSSSWVRILVVVVLLLLVAAGFYLLSRSFDDEEVVNQPTKKTPVVAKKTTKVKARQSTKRSTRKRKPRSTTK